MNTMSPIRHSFMLRLYGPALLVVLWYGVVAARVIEPILLPPPHRIMLAVVSELQAASCWHALGATLLRVMVGFLVASLFGIPIGLILGIRPSAWEAVEFLFDFFRSLPAVALFPIFMLFFGLGDTARIGTTAFSCGLVMVLHSYYGVARAPRLRRDLAAVMGAAKSEVLRRVILPDALGQILVGARIALSLGVVVVLVTEMVVVSETGLGRRLLEAQQRFRAADLFADVLLVGALGLGLNWAVGLFERRTMPWVRR
jgi:NitT/TauT family transport system permease protein